MIEGLARNEEINRVQCTNEKGEGRDKARKRTSLSDY